MYQLQFYAQGERLFATEADITDPFDGIEPACEVASRFVAIWNESHKRKERLTFGDIERRIVRIDPTPIVVS